MTLSHLQGHSYARLSNVIFRKAVQQLTRFQLTWRVARSLCGSGASCYLFIYIQYHLTEAKLTPLRNNFKTQRSHSVTNLA